MGANKATLDQPCIGNKIRRLCEHLDHAWFSAGFSFWYLRANLLFLSLFFSLLLIFIFCFSFSFPPSFFFFFLLPHSNVQFHRARARSFFDSSFFSPCFFFFLSFLFLSSRSFSPFLVLFNFTFPLLLGARRGFCVSSNKLHGRVNFTKNFAVSRYVRRRGRRSEKTNKAFDDRKDEVSGGYFSLSSREATNKN